MSKFVYKRMERKIDIDKMEEARVHLKEINLKKDFVLVEYPGLVKNDATMLNTLGGLARISDVFCGEKRRLELKFQPNSWYRKPAYGDLQQTAGLLLKIKRNIKADNKDEPLTHSVEIVGRVKRVVKFNGLCDYQYLPVLRNPQTGKMEYIYPKVVPENIPDSNWLKDEPPLFFPPAVFARDNVNTTLFRGENIDDSTDDNLGISINRRDEFRAYDSFNMTDPVPSAPNPAISRTMSAKLVTNEQFLAVKKLFNECPIWPRIALIYESNVRSAKLKFILPALAYYYTTGPWKTMWIRYGYDPRKHYESRYYQTFDFRLRTALGINEYVKIKRGVYKQNKMKVKCLNSSTNANQEDEYPYFEEGTLPRSRQCFFRYCDLRFPKIKEMLEAVPTPSSGATCNEKTGWLPPSFDDQCRQILSAAIVDHFKKSVRREGGMDEEIDELTDDEEDDEYFDIADESTGIDNYEDIELN